MSGGTFLLLTAGVANVLLGIAQGYWYSWLVAGFCLGVGLMRWAVDGR